MKRLFIYSNKLDLSNEIEKNLRQYAKENNIIITDELDSNVDMIVCIGGDGTLLSLMHEKQFPTIPVVGINTGHLGFFQEVKPNQIQELISAINCDRLVSQPYNIAKATVVSNGKIYDHRGLNEFAFKNPGGHPLHLNISINDSFIEKFSGDGILVSTPAGSTGYNYSLGGSIVDPRLNILQVTPIAPMNTGTYRSITSSIMLPSNDKLRVVPCEKKDASISVYVDGFVFNYEEVESVTLSLSRRKINLVHFNDTTFWDKVKSKFL